MTKNRSSLFQRWVVVVISLGAIPFLGARAFAAPYTTPELYSTEKSDEAQIRKLRNQEVTQLKLTLGRHLPAHRRADLYFQLAESYLESYRATFLLEGRVHEKRLEEKVPDRLIDRSNSKPFLKAGIEVCLEIIKLKIPYSKMDQVYYFLGFNYGELEDSKESIKYYSELAKKYPKSEFAGPAEKEIGSYYFGKAQFREAQIHLETALKKFSEDNWAPILHKLAWCYYRQRQFDRAVSTMKDAIARAGSQPNQFAPLKEEALRDMAIILTESGHVDDAIQYFQETSGNQKAFPDLLEKLGSQYERKAELPKAIRVYEALLKMRPKGATGLKELSKLVEFDQKQGQFLKALERLKAHADLLAGSSSSSSSRDSSDGENSSALENEAQGVIQNLRVLVRKTATSHQQAYRKNQKKSELEIAEAYYTFYLDPILKNEDPHHERPEIQMYLAEAKRDLGKAKETVELYRQVVASKDKRYSKEAAGLWLGSLVEALKGQAQHSGSAPSALELQFIEASDLIQESRIAQGNGDSSEARESALRIAQVLAGYSSTHKEAIERIQEILTKWPKTPQALTAAQLWIQMVTDERPVSASALASLRSELRKNSGLMAIDQSQGKGKIKAFLDQEDEKEKVNTISKFEKEQDFAQAAKGYEDFANSTSQRDLAEKAYANAMEDLSKTGNSQAALLSLADRWLKRYPRSPKAQESLRILGTQSLVRGDFELSGRVFQLLGTQYPDAGSLETAARIQEATGNSKSAQETLSRYLELYKTSDRFAKIALHLGNLQEQSNLEGEASRSYRACASISGPLQMECQALQADLYLKSRNVPKAKEMYQMLGKQVSRQGKKVAPTSPYVGYARFKLAELSETEATFEPLRFPEARLQKALAQRLNFLEPLSRSYQSVVEVGGPWGIAALHRLALWAAQFADEVDRIEPPASLQGAGLVKFKRDLASVSQPLREKAKATWSQSYSRITSVNLFSPALPEVADRLADFKVAVPGRAQGPHGQFHLSSSKSGDVQAIRDRLLKNTRDAPAWVDYGIYFWNDNKPLLASLCFERALSINSHQVAAMNNMAVMKLSGDGEEDWVSVYEAVDLLEGALKVDDYYGPAKVNLATVLNYYRIFEKAKVLWDQVLHQESQKPAGSRDDSLLRDAYDGSGISLQGLSRFSDAMTAFSKANDLGASQSRFTWVYHQAAQASLQGPEGAERCSAGLGGLDASNASGFEKKALQHLKDQCELWKKSK